MKRRFALVLLAAVMLAPRLAAAATTTWELDPAHTASSFSVKHLVITTVHGQFGKTTGTLQLDDVDLTRSSVTAEVDVTTLDTHEPNRHKHLESPDFFDAANPPRMVFRSIKVAKRGKGELDVTGDLTIRETTKPITLHVTYDPRIVKDPQGNERRAFSATGKLNRKDYGLNWSKTVEAGPIVGDEVQITVEAEAVRKTDPS